MSHLKLHFSDTNIPNRHDRVMEFFFSFFNNIISFKIFIIRSLRIVGIFITIRSYNKHSNKLIPSQVFRANGFVSIFNFKFVLLYGESTNLFLKFLREKKFFVTFLL